jgi:hypothetical protein
VAFPQLTSPGFAQYLAAQQAGEQRRSNMATYQGLSAGYYLDRAAEARLAAGEVKDEQSRATLLRIAEEYEILADRAERLAQKPR